VARLLDFGRGHWFEHLDATRRFLWAPDALEDLLGPAVLDSRAGLRIADLGCGWGYLGHLLLDSVSPGGSIHGYDLSEELIARARSRAREASVGRRLRFELADCTRLEDVPDDRYDRAICQTLLIHLARPVEALAEMRRIVRPGGRVVAIEPDLLAARASRHDCVDEEHPVLVELRSRVQSCIIQGGRRLGTGDYRIGPKLAGCMADAGLQEPRLLLNSTVYQCTPPYDEAAAAYRDFLLGQLTIEAFRAETESLRPLFDAGEGDPALWDELQLLEERLLPERRRRLVQGTCRFAATNALYVAVGLVG